MFKRVTSRVELECK